MATATGDRRLSNTWADLQEEGAVPDKGEGKTAQLAERDKTRKTRRYPSEDKRIGTKIGPTLSRDLVRRLRAICKAEGHVDQTGEGVIVSSVIEDLLTAGVEAYERGEFDQVEEVVEVRRRLKRRAKK